MRCSKGTQGRGRCLAALIAGGVAFEFFATPCAAGFRNAGGFAVPVEMPEAPVDKNADAVAWKNDVGMAWQIAAVQPEAVSHRMKHSANGQLGLCVLAANPAHQAAARLWTQSISHPSKKLPRILQKCKACRSANVPVGNDAPEGPRMTSAFPCARRDLSKQVPCSATQATPCGFPSLRSKKLVSPQGTLFWLPEKLFQADRGSRRGEGGFSFREMQSRTGVGDTKCERFFKGKMKGSYPSKKRR